MSDERYRSSTDADSLIDVMFEPAPGHTDAEVVTQLQKTGAVEVELLAPGFVSARLARGRLKELASVAIAHPKVRKRLHGY